MKLLPEGVCALLGSGNWVGHGQGFLQKGTSKDAHCIQAMTGGIGGNFVLLRMTPSVTAVLLKSWIGSASVINLASTR